MSAPTMNTLDYIKGSKPAFSLSAYVASGGAGSYTALGTIHGVEVDYQATVKDLTADTAIYVLDQFVTGVKCTIKGTLDEADMIKMFAILNNLSGTLASPTNPAVVARIAGTTDGTVTGLVGTPTLTYWQAQLIIDDQSFKSGATDIYTRRTYTFWRCLITPKIKQSPKKDDHLQNAFEMEVLYDSSVGTNDKMFKVVDYMAK